MNEERAKAAFDIRAMTILMDGGEKNTIVKYICIWFLSRFIKLNYLYILA